ncbi:MAG: SPASM domain-containing protein [Candidatus Vogelbacteria bacterium]|nr:SPASM domain-containing protein [Candidatus Vogelbacteria bacterium]
MPTFDCNLRCVYCYANGGREKLCLNPILAWSAIDSVVSRTKDSKDLPLAIYFVGGGEPFRNFPLMFNVCEYAKTKFASVDITVVSNGLLNNQQLGWLITNRVATRISYDGEAQDEHRPLISGRSSKGVVEETIRKLALSGIPLTIQLTITGLDVSLSRLKESIDRIVSLGGRYIKIEPVHSSVLSRANPSLVPDLKEFVDRFIEAVEYIVNNGLDVKIDNSFISRPTSGYYCGAGEGSNVTITPAGYITSCLEVSRPDEVFADKMIYGKCTAEDGICVDKEKRNSLDRLHWRNFTGCPECSLKLICGGGCPMQGGWDHGDLFKPSTYICMAHKLLLPRLFKLMFDKPQAINVLFDNHTVTNFC